MNTIKVKEYMKVAILALIVVSLGMITINQSLDYYYRNQFLAGPCQLCADLNPGIGDCFKDLQKQKEMMEDNYYLQYKEVKLQNIINFSVAT